MEKMSEEERRKAEEKKAAQEETEQVFLPVTKEENLEVSVKEESKEVESVLQLDFRVWGTREQLLALRNYMNENHLRFGKVE